MVPLVALVEKLEGFRAARGEKEVMPSHSVLQDREHGVAAVRVENVASSVVDRVVVIDGSARREPLGGVRTAQARGGESHDVGYLFPCRVYHPQRLPFPQLKGDASLRRQVVAKRAFH